MGIWDRLRPRTQGQERTPPPEGAVANPELESLIARGAQGESVDVVGALLRATLVIPTGGEVGPHFEGFDPVFYARDQTPVLTVFTSLERVRPTTDLATHALTMTGRDLLLRMSSGYGLGVNPGDALGFELSPDGVAAAAARARTPERPSPLTMEQCRVIGTALARVAPRGWVALDLTVVCVGPETRSRLAVRMPGGRTVKATGPVPREVTRLLRELRSAAYRPDLGTWFTAHLVVEADGRIGLEVDGDNPPPLEPAPGAWADELRRFPRDPQHLPSWLQERAPAEPEWSGARWQVDIRPHGAPPSSATLIDATTTPESRSWALTIVDRLAAEGVEARIRQDEGEDGRGSSTTYDELLVTVGEGYMALAFWRDLIAWTVDVFADQADRATVSDVATRVLSAVQDVTGYSLDRERLGPYERSLIRAGGA